jgi:MOSC domain-containing protein
MLGTVTALYRYPVKALRGERLALVAVDAGGIVGDRARALFVHGDGHARSGKTYRGKENRLLHTVDSVGAAQDVALGAGVTLEAHGEQPHYFDAEPVSIVFDTWLRELEVLAGRPVEALRFRPNVVAEAAPGFDARERDLVGGRIKIGDVVFEVVSPITRCVTISYDVATGEADPALQRTIVGQRDNKMGIYCRVLTPGTLVAGTAIEPA